jgi:two-component system, NtrC family, sensor kinase
MHLPKLYNLQTKFIVGLVFAAIALGSIFSAGSYLHLRSVMELEVEDKARLIFAHVDSIQHYVRDTLRPAMYEHFPAAFIIQAMSSSFISRQIMSPVHAPENGSLFRRVAIDARNPDYEANQLERELISYFRQDAARELWQGYQVLNGDRHYVMARPVRFDQQCLYCHGSPENAPADLLKLYGNRGFGKDLGAIAGLDFVATSVERSVGRVRQTILTFFAFFAFGALLFFFATNVLFRLLVAKNLKRLSDVFRRHATDIESTTLLHQLEQKDEIDELVGGIEHMSEHLFEARRQLQNYAENLRKMVDDRTAALSRETEARKADVHLFVSLLQDMSKSRSRSELWHYALPQVCNRFNARRISYVCTMASQGSYVWPENEPNPTEPEGFVEILTGGVCVLRDASIYVPVESSTGNAEGLLCLTWASAHEAARHEFNVLQALGRQLGVAAENLSAIDSLARQMNILETIVEGITDPLMLMDAGCAVLTVNRAAKNLTAELTGGTRTDGNILSLFFDIGRDNCPIKEMITRKVADQRDVSLSSGRSFSLSLYPVPGQSGDTDQVVVYLRETTMERRMQMQIRQTEKMATVGKLTAGLAHEINNPLGVIRCYTGLLRQAITDSQQLGDLDIIERHTNQAQRVLRDLLNFARPKTTGSGKADACLVARSVGEVFSVQAAKKHVAITVDTPHRQLLVGIGIGELEQVIGNLTINAIDAVSEHVGKIVITVKDESAGLIAIIVEDNGPGVAAADEPHLFDPFFSTKDIGAGTGLGLTITYGIVNSVGGLIEIGRSTRLGGACFSVFLPIVSNDGHAETS